MADPDSSIGCSAQLCSSSLLPSKLGHSSSSSSVNVDIDSSNTNNDDVASTTSNTPKSFINSTDNEFSSSSSTTITGKNSLNNITSEPIDSNINSSSNNSSYPRKSNRKSKRSKVATKNNKDYQIVKTNNKVVIQNSTSLSEQKNDLQNNNTFNNNSSINNNNIISQRNSFSTLKYAISLSLAKVFLVLLTHIPIKAAAYPILGIQNSPIDDNHLQFNTPTDLDSNSNSNSNSNSFFSTFFKSSPSLSLFSRSAVTAASSVVVNASKTKTLEEMDPRDYWIYMGISCSLVLLGGIFAGLTLGLMGQDEIYLQVIQQSGELSEKKAAGKVLSLLQRGKHWVLVTLLCK